MNKQFEEWWQTHEVYDNTPMDLLSQYDFYELPFSLQWGVYLEFFDSVGIRINAGFQWFRIFKQGATPYFEDKFKSRQEAQQEAIKKAFEILK
jgi:hypothetical protein